MSVPANILQQVITYQEGSLALLSNFGAFVSTSNKKFQNFESMIGNLGATVSFDLPPRLTSTNSLVATFQGADQRVQNLTVGNAISTAFAFTAQQFIFNVEDYMTKFGRAATAVIGTKIEANVALNADQVPYRFYGDGYTPINSVNQLALALAEFRTIGMPMVNTRGYLSDLVVPTIVANALNQFVMDRNERMANSWEIGAFDNCEWYKSNLLPLHIAGTVGNTINNVLTVVSVTTDATGAVIAITFSGAGTNDPNAIKQYDNLMFNDGVSGMTNMRFLTWTGYETSGARVQFQATANAGSNGGGDVTVSVYPPLQATASNNQNLNTAILAGMQVSVLPNHRAGMISADNALFLAMPKLPPQIPFPTASETDPDMGVSLRMTYGSALGENRMGFVYDAIWGSTSVPEYLMKLVFPA